MGGPTDPRVLTGETLEMFRLGVGLHNQGNLAAAEAVYEEVLRRAPGNPDAQLRLGAVAAQSGRFDAALGWLDQAIAVHPTAAAFAHRGDAQQGLGDLSAALPSYDRALALDPRSAQALSGRGGVLLRLDRLDEALVSYDQALAADPDSAVGWYNRAAALRQLLRLDEAIAAYERAIALKPDFAVAHHNLASCLLLTGQWVRGLAEYEWRKATPDYPSDSAYSRPAWTGAEALAGRTLFIHPELYLGDLIQFTRYARLAEAAGARVILAAPQPMHRLLSTLSPTIELVAADTEPPAYDFHCALMSLPRAFGTTPGDPPHETPYLRPDPERVALWGERIGGEGLRIGVCWQGSTAPHALAMRRSFPLAELRAIAARPGVRLISLQKTDGLDQLESLPPGMAVETLGADFDAGPDAFLDAAAAIAACDLVISADTAVAHLAGALGAKVWLALPHLPDWRWLLDRDDSPWYPTMRLFRQGTDRAWAGVFAAMGVALDQL